MVEHTTEPEEGGPPGRGPPWGLQKIPAINMVVIGTFLVLEASRHESPGYPVKCTDRQHRARPLWSETGMTGIESASGPRHGRQHLS